jgi:hypothetical protein
LPLPAPPYDACQKWAERASSPLLVRFHGNDYSVLVRYANRELLLRGYVEQVVPRTPLLGPPQSACGHRYRPLPEQNSVGKGHRSGAAE